VPAGGSAWEVDAQAEAKKQTPKKKESRKCLITIRNLADNSMENVKQE
jgi:hypothetical protein